MASHTPNLDLLKKDPATDGNETFNIQTMLNDNWDKIDEAVGEVREAVEDIEVPPASVTQAGIVQLSNATNSSAENVAATPKAVKAAYDLANTANTTAQSSLTAGNERKAELVAALVAKGVSATTSETWAQLLAKVTALVKATGTATAGQVLSGITFSNATANGLTGTMTNNGAGGTVTPGATAQTKPAGYYSSPITVSAVTFTPANVLAGTTIAGTAGTMPNRGAVTNTIAEQNGSYTIPAGYHNGGGKVTATYAAEQIMGPGENLLFFQYLGTIQSASNSSYAKVRTIVVGKSGTYRIRFSMRPFYSGSYGRARIYKNGIAYGVERTFLSEQQDGPYQEYTEDLAFNAGDTIELWIAGLNINYTIPRVYGDKPSYIVPISS